MATPHFAVADVRTPAELALFSHPMPLVTAAVKRMIETEHGRDAARLLPAISKVHGKPSLNLADLVYIGGGALIDTYKNIDKVMALLAGCRALRTVLPRLSTTLSMLSMPSGVRSSS